MDEYVKRQNDIMRAYQITLLGDDRRPLPYAKLILEDLAVFCGETAEGRKLDHNGQLDQGSVVYMMGRADVMKRIRMWLNRREDGYDRFSQFDFAGRGTGPVSRWARLRQWLGQLPLVWRGDRQGQ